MIFEFDLDSVQVAEGMSAEVCVNLVSGTSTDVETILLDPNPGTASGTQVAVHAVWS